MMAKPALSADAALALKPRAPKPRIDPRQFYRWEGVFENWSKQWVRKHGWRTRQLWGSDEDALQQCALTFAKCLDRYAAKVDKPAHLMALYKTAVANHWHKHAVFDGRYRQLHHPENLEAAPEGIARRASITFNDGPLAAAMAGASQELQQVLRMIAQAPDEVLRILLPTDGETPDLDVLNRRFRRWFGLPAKAEVATELKNLLMQ